MKSITVLFDTNIILDFLEEREPFNETANVLFKACDEHKINGYIAAHSIPDIFYILRKDYSVDERKDMLLGVCETMKVAGIDRDKLVAALTNKDFADFEDCLHIECAKSVNAAYIVTRNPTDFAGSAVPILEPEAFLRLFYQTQQE
jgi:predicted nucleic acid-binding protein